MREILFRGKRTENGEWIEGFYAKSGDKHFILIDNDFAIGYVKMKEVILETVGQFTGLTDKNGKKIFEGDILSDGDDTYKVVFDEGVFQIENSHYTTGVYVAIHIDKIDEVIGNAYDNPELLEVMR